MILVRTVYWFEGLSPSDGVDIDVFFIVYIVAHCRSLKFGFIT